MSYLPAELRGPHARLFTETPEERFNRRMAVAALLRRRRRLAGLTFRQVAHAALMDASRISRYEQGWQYPGPEAAERVLAAIERLEKEGAGDPEKAAAAKAEYEAADAEAAGSPR